MISKFFKVSKPVTTYDELITAAHVLERGNEGVAIDVPPQVLAELLGRHTQASGNHKNPVALSDRIA